MRFFRFAVLALLSSACSSKGSVDVADAGSAPSVTVARAASLAVVRDVAKLHAPLAYAFAHGDGLSMRDGRISSTGDRAGDFEHLAARFPLAADGALEVDVARVARLRVSLTPVGARPVAAKMTDGRAIYEDAFPSADLVALGNAFYAEHLVVLRDANAKPSITYRMQLGKGLVPRWQDGNIVLADANGEGRLRVLAPWAVDAHGVVRDAKMTLDRDQLHVELDPTGLAYPIVLDPAVESVLWEKMAPTKSPSPRTDVTMAFDSDRNVTVLYGGNTSLSTYTPIGDTWEYDGKTWTQKCGAPLTACALPALARHSMEYDKALKTTWLHAQDSSFGSWLGQWNGTTWATSNVGYPAPSGTPTATAWAGTAYDSKRSVVVKQGGNLGFGPVDDTWTWNGSWTHAVTDTGCKEAPYCRYGAMMTYHAATDSTILFGGYDNTSTATNVTWVWNGSAWSTPLPGGSPSYRANGRLVYDSTRKRSVLFGGQQDNTTYFDDTYEWTGTTWTPITPLTKPGARAVFAMAFDQKRGRVVLFGGQTYAASATSLLAETWEYHSRGAACTAATDCDTGSCVDGVCCEGTCGTCERCDGTSPGTCTKVLSADDDTCKAPTATCNPAGVCKKLQGQACTTGTDCLNGICVDGVCCGTACTGICQACKASLKADGLNDGTCGAAKDGLNPHSDCTAGAGGSCGQTGVCDGFGKCALQPTGKSCGTGSVCEGTIAKGQQCDGIGGCVSNPTGTDCVPGKCIMGCKLDCTTDADCDSSGYCDTTAHQCKTKNKNGTACASASECENPFCVDGVCCNKPCSGQCEACNSKDAVGTCVPIVGKPIAPRADCAAEPTGSCKQTTCNGVDGTACSGFVGGEVLCQAGACTDGKSVSEVHCNGKGDCPLDEPKVCEPYACGDKACKSSCTTNDDCKAPATCDTTSGKCVNAAKCDGEHTLTSADGMTTTDCTPYACEASGKCKTSCATSTDCAPPAICSDTACVAPPAEDTGSSGGCSTTSRGTSGLGLAAVSLLALAMTRRRSAR